MMDGYYQGIKMDRRVVYVDGHGKTSEVTPGPSQAIWNHSPDGFNWGYGGSGPAQLALALLLRFVPRERAIKLCQQFKRDFLVNCPDDFILTDRAILAWISGAEKEGS